MNAESSSNFYTVSLVFSIIGGLLVLLTDFGGWLEPTYYGENDYYVFIGSENAPFYSQLILGLIGLSCFGISYFSYQGMQNNLSEEMLTRSIYLGIGTCVVIILAAITFIIEASDTIDYWLDVGFYGGLLGDGIATIFLRLQQINIRKN